MLVIAVSVVGMLNTQTGLQHPFKFMPNNEQATDSLLDPKSSLSGVIHLVL